MATSNRLKNIKTIAINVRIPHDCNEWLRGKAEANDITLGQALTRLLRAAQREDARYQAEGERLMADLAGIPDPPERTGPEPDMTPFMVPVDDAEDEEDRKLNDRIARIVRRELGKR